MYSQQWSPAPSITAWAPELRTAKRSPAVPAANSLPPVAPYRQVLPMIAVLWLSKRLPRGGTSTTLPPFMPLPT